MSNITDWIKYELYPTLFQSIDIALPEHDFKRYPGGWKSKTYLDGSPHKNRADKTVISKNAPGRILEQGGDNLSIIDYIIRRDKIDVLQACKTLADIVGLPLPKGEFNQENYLSQKEQATILEDCNSYFIYCLENSPGAEEVRAYLYSRGYSDEDIKAMELGYIPDQDKLFKYLLSKGYSQGLIDEAVTIKTDTRIGSTHKLTIPYRSGGSVKGFKFRVSYEDISNSIVGGFDENIDEYIEGLAKRYKEAKYLNSKGLDRIGGFFNLLGIKGDKDLVIVEGELDSLSATARGIDNVVATGGSSISSEQVKDAIKRGAKSFTICFDREPGKEEETEKNINKAIEVILGEGVNKVYIVTLPDLGEGKTDPDRLINEKGVEAFRDAIVEACSYYEYKLQATINKYGKIENERGLQAKDIDNLLEDVVETASHILDATNRDRYKKLFTSLDAIKQLGITEESLSITIDRLTSTREKESQDRELKKTLKKASELQAEGKREEAIEFLDSNLKKVKLKNKATEFNKLLLPTSEAQIKEEEASLPDSLNSGISIAGEELLLPGGAISVISAPTNHGKTIFLINTALNVAERYPDKKFIFFTYEERDTAILQYFLNTYINISLNSSDKGNRRVLRHYFKTGSTQFFSSKILEYFNAKKEEFFKTYIETGRILVKYVDYNSKELDLAIRYLHEREPNIGGVYVDYFQLLNLPGETKRAERINSRQEELKEICQTLKRVAVNTGLPLILAGQFNREVTNLMRLHPTHIGEAGDIERIVNTLVGLWNMDKKPVLKGITEAEADEINKRMFNRKVQGDGAKNMYLEILKSRDLPTGSYDFLDFDGNTGKIKNRVEIDVAPKNKVQDFK
jgi:DNA primase